MDTLVATTPSRAAPGPRGYPLVGALPKLRRAPLQFLLACARDYGDVVRLGSMGPRAVFLVSHPEDIKYILLTHGRNFGKVQHSGSIDLLGAEAMALYDGPKWLTRRRILNPLFKPRQVSDFVPLMAKATHALLERWAPLAKAGKPVDILPEMMQVTLDIIAKTMFSADIATGDPALGHAIDAVLRWVGGRLWSPVKLPLSVPTPGNRRFVAARHTLHALIRGVVEQRQRSGRDCGDMLSRLIGARDEETGASLTTQEICDEVISFFIAGHETTASALTWLWYLLSMHPASARRLCAEVDTVVGERGVTAEDLPKLEYTRQVIEETMRLYPPGWLIGRQCLEDDHVGAFAIPAGSVIMVSPYVTHRTATAWRNPEGFDPDRFAAATTQQRPRFAYLPFGGGPFSCIANGFAMAELQLVAASVVQKYSLSLLAGHEVTPFPAFALRPKGGLPMFIEPRSR